MCLWVPIIIASSSVVYDIRDCGVEGGSGTGGLHILMSRACCRVDCKHSLCRLNS